MHTIQLELPAWIKVPMQGVCCLCTSGRSQPHFLHTHPQLVLWSSGSGQPSPSSLALLHGCPHLNMGTEAHIPTLLSLHLSVPFWGVIPSWFLHSPVDLPYWSLEKGQMPVNLIFLPAIRVEEKQRVCRELQAAPKDRALFHTQGPSK